MRLSDSARAAVLPRQPRAIGAGLSFRGRSGAFVQLAVHCMRCGADLHTLPGAATQCACATAPTRAVR